MLAGNQPRKAHRTACAHQNADGTTIACTVGRRSTIASLPSSIVYGTALNRRSSATLRRSGRPRYSACAAGQAWSGGLRQKVDNSTLPIQGEPLHSERTSAASINRASTCTRCQCAMRPSPRPSARAAARLLRWGTTWVTTRRPPRLRRRTHCALPGCLPVPRRLSWRSSPRGPTNWAGRYGAS